MIAAGLWGLAEATLFFIVPDVYLTNRAVTDLKRALWCCLTAAVGAMAGGVVMYWWGARDLETARQALDWVPAIAPAMLEQVSQSLREDGLRAVFLGPLFGIPYKIFAVHASAAGIDTLVFLAITLPARLPRFVLASLLTAGLSRLLASRVSLTGRYALLWGFWIISYGVYFITMSN